MDVICLPEINIKDFDFEFVKTYGESVNDGLADVKHCAWIILGCTFLGLLIS